MKNTPKLSRFASPFIFIRYVASLILFSGGCLSLGLVHTPTVFAQVSQVSLTLSREQNESYANFMQRATKLTVDQLKNRFSQKSPLNQVRVVVIGENNGVVAPVLSVNMSRQQWLSNPNPQPLINYFQDSQFLLGFDAPTSPKPEKAATPPSNPTNAPNPATPSAAPPANQPNSAGNKNAPTPPPSSSPNQSPIPAQVTPLDNPSSSTPPQTTPANSLNNRFRQGIPSQSN